MGFRGGERGKRENEVPGDGWWMVGGGREGQIRGTLPLDDIFEMGDGCLPLSLILQADCGEEVITLDAISHELLHLRWRDFYPQGEKREKMPSQSSSPQPKSFKLNNHRGPPLRGVGGGASGRRFLELWVWRNLPPFEREDRAWRSIHQQQVWSIPFSSTMAGARLS